MLTCNRTKLGNAAITTHSLTLNFWQKNFHNLFATAIHTKYKIAKTVDLYSNFETRDPAKNTRGR